jgi:hypothetical protein
MNCDEINSSLSNWVNLSFIIFMAV